MKREVWIPIVVAIVFVAVGFFAGMHYQRSQRNFAGGPGGNMMFGNGGGTQRGNGGQRTTAGQGLRPIIGEIISTDNNSITVKLEDGSTKIVLLSDTTPINKTDPGVRLDLAVGTRVGVFGADNNGTVTAQSIQINPQQMRVMSSPSPAASAK